MIWHKRLGHASEAILKKIQQLDVGNYNQLCDSCIRAKQTRLHFPIRFSKSMECFDLTHIDIWGQYKHATLNGEHYFLSIVGDYSRGFWVYLMTNKYKVGYFLIYFYNIGKTQFYKELRGYENLMVLNFNQDTCLISIKNKKYSFKLCAPTYQNRMVLLKENTNIYWKRGRALRFQTSLPIEFWGDCVLTVAYIINRLPTRALDSKTPHKILLGKLPTYNQLNVLGCLAYVHDNI